METLIEAIPKSIFPHITRSDHLIQQDIVWNLTQNGLIDGRHLEVSVSEGRAVIRGEVPTRTLKKMVVRCLQGIVGIIHIENQLKIKRVSRFSDGHSMHGF